MDLRAYYRKVREAEAGLDGEHVVVVSLSTPEGGKAGVRTETPRLVAAKLIALGSARAATEEETAAFEKEKSEAKVRWEQEEAARRMQVVVIPSNELKRKERG